MPTYRPSMYLYKQLECCTRSHRNTSHEVPCCHVAITVYNLFPKLNEFNLETATILLLPWLESGFRTSFFQQIETASKFPLLICFFLPSANKTTLGMSPLCILGRLKPFAYILSWQGTIQLRSKNHILNYCISMAGLKCPAHQQCSSACSSSLPRTCQRTTFGIQCP